MPVEEPSSSSVGITRDPVNTLDGDAQEAGDDMGHLLTGLRFMSAAAVKTASALQRMDSNVTDISAASSSSTSTSSNVAPHFLIRGLSPGLVARAGSHNGRSSDRVPPPLTVIVPTTSTPSSNKPNEGHHSASSSPGTSPTGFGEESLKTMSPTASPTSPTCPSSISPMSPLPSSVAVTFTAATPTSPPTTALHLDAPQVHRKYSRAHNNRFHRRFPQVGDGEKLVNYYSCALVADILLQGYLYISENFFAFYSNIFGYKTKILIPLNEVISVTKERTAKIIPNAVGICTDKTKYVFGSLLSRETTFRLMQEVWRQRVLAACPIEYYNCDSHRESADTGSESPCTPVTKSKGVVDALSSVGDEPPPLIVLAAERDAALFALKTGSLSRSTLAPSDRKTLSLERKATVSIVKNENRVDSSDSGSDMNSADESSRGIKGVARLNMTAMSSGSTTRRSRVCLKLQRSASECVRGLRSGVKRLSNTPALISITTILLVIMLVSALVLIVRLNQVHEKMTFTEVFLSNPSNSVAKIRSAQARRELKAISRNVRERLQQLQEFRESMFDLITSVEHLAAMCTTDCSSSNTNDDAHGAPAVLTSGP